MSDDRMRRDAGESGREWAWATEHAAPEWATTVELVSWLARGELPPHTLVWKPGWGEWLPALQVTELAAAFPSVTPGSRRVARPAAGAAEPPPVPVSQYPRLRLLARDVIRDSSGPYPAVIARRLDPAPEAPLVKYLDADHAQQELVTRQVPAAAMLEAAQAMQAPDPAMKQRTSSRWSGLERGVFGDTAAPSAALPPGTLPPGTLPPGTLPPGTLPPGTLPPGTLPPATLPPATSSPATLSPATLPPRSLAALELSSVEQETPSPARRSSSGYGRWIAFGVLAGSALGALSASELWPRAAALRSVLALSPQRPAESKPVTAAPTAVAPPQQRTPAPAAPVLAPLPQQPSALPPSEAPRAQPTAPAKPGRIRVRHDGEPALLQAMRVTANDGFDRVVFEFRERVPGYRIDYLDGPARDCDSGQPRRVEGSARLELRFFPARAHDESGAPTFRPRELKPALGMVRELERSCARNDVLTWVAGTSSANRYRAYEMADPPRLVVQIEH